MELRQMIVGERNPPAPSVGPVRSFELGEDTLSVFLQPVETANIAGALKLAKPAIDHAIVWFLARIDDDAATVGNGVSLWQDAVNHIAWQRSCGPQRWRLVYGANICIFTGPHLAGPSRRFHVLTNNGILQNNRQTGENASGR